jgi:putative transposase
MARLARVIIPGLPYHVTQRGKGGQKVFFPRPTTPLIAQIVGAAREAAVAVSAWQLMPNHVHLVLAPEGEDGLRHALVRVHRSYAGTVRARRKGAGHFWQGRFGAVAMDEPHLAAAFRYVTLDPAPARLVSRAEDWPWSSARAHPGLGDDAVTDLAPARQRFSRFADLLEGNEDTAATSRLRKAESVGRYIGSESLLAELEAQTRRRLRPLERGPKPTADLAG